MGLADFVVMIAIPAPMAMLGLLVLGDVGVAEAVFIALGSITAATTTLDIRWWVLQRRQRMHRQGGSGS